MATSFSRAWRIRCDTKAARLSRKRLKNQVARANRRAAKKNPDCGVVARLNNRDVI